MNWKEYSNYPLAEVIVARIKSKNGYLGAAFISKRNGVFYLSACGETGLPWKSPDSKFDSVESAKDEAEKRWIGI